MIKTKDPWHILKNVFDPEIPVLSVIDMGIIRKIEELENELIVTITPTYNGCPAMDMISMHIRVALMQEGFEKVQINTVLTPAWTTDWITENGKQKLKEYGIAPPVGSADTSTLSLEEKVIPCPLCESTHTEMISQFGSTACKALYKCIDCLEPFDYFKCH